MAQQPASREAVRLVVDGVQPSFESVGRAQGLPSSSVYKVLVDRHGFVWVSGNNGIHRFDGHSVHNLDRDPDRPDSLASRLNFAIAETEEGIWIGSPDGTVQRLDARDGRLTVVPVLRSPDGARPKVIIWMDHDARGRIWMRTDLGILRLDPATGTVVAAAPQVLVPHFPSVAYFGSDRRRLFVATQDFRVLALDVDAPRTSATLLTIPEPDRAPITAMVSSGNVLWLVAGAQLWRFDVSDASLRKIDMPVPLPRVTTMAVARDGVLWMGSGYDNGLFRFDPKRSELSIYRNHPGDPQSLRSDQIRSLAIDHHDNLWIGLLRDGVARLRLGQAAVARYRLEDSRSQSVCAIQEGENRQLLIVSCGGSLGRLDLGTGQVVDLSAELDRALASPAPALSAHVLAADGAGGYWIPTDSDGLLHWQPQSRRTTRYSIEGDGPGLLPRPYMYDALLDAGQRLWVGHQNGLAVLEPGARSLKNVDVPDGAGTFEVAGVLDVSPGPQGSLWLGTSHGVVNFSPDQQRARRFQHQRNNPDSLSDNLVLVTHTDSAGRFWAGTQAGL
ncbi:MAG: ligand-binding sensor domain-containing protein, partial [Lysobacter sp.]